MACGMVSAYYIRTLNIDEPLARIDFVNNNIRYCHADALGSIIALTDESGAIKTQYSYSPFGLTKEIGEASGNPFKFTGREEDETGLYYYRARYYSPEMGRFLSEDPIGFAGGDVNFYSYVGNSSVNWIDPLGLARGDWWDARTYLPDLAGARRIAGQVLIETQQNFHNSSLHNDAADAWRHARWNERMVNEIGWGTAVIAGYGHELENLYDQWREDERLRWDEMLMDLHNNREGRSGRSAWDLLNEGSLRTINPTCKGKGGLY